MCIRDRPTAAGRTGPPDGAALPVAQHGVPRFVVALPGDLARRPRRLGEPRDGVHTSRRGRRARQAPREHRPRLLPAVLPTGHIEGTAHVGVEPREAGTDERKPPACHLCRSEVGIVQRDSNRRDGERHFERGDSIERVGCSRRGGRGR
eukprot:5057727-Prymnesium_polylepis.1